MVWQLAQLLYRQPQLATQLQAMSPPRFMRPKEADLTALLQLGELDYIWTYRSIARANGFRWLDLPPEINLSDPALASTYAQAKVTLPGATQAKGDTVVPAPRDRGGVRALPVFPGGSADHRRRRPPAGGVSSARRAGTTAVIFAGPFPPRVN